QRIDAEGRRPALESKPQNRIAICATWAVFAQLYGLLFACAGASLEGGAGMLFGVAGLTLFASSVIVAGIAGWLVCWHRAELTLPDIAIGLGPWIVLCTEATLLLWLIFEMR